MSRRSILQHLTWVGLVCVALAGGCASQQPAESNVPPQNAADARFEAGAKRAPTAQTLYSLAQILAIQGNDEQAAYAFTTTIHSYPNFMPAYCGLAQSQMRQRQTDEAIKTLEAGLAICPNESILLNNLGMCHLMSGENKMALENFTMAAASSPDEPRYRSNMAVALVKLGRIDEALSLYSEILPAATAHRNVALLCEARGDRATAQTQRKLAEMFEQESKSDSAASAEPQGTVGDR